MVSRLWFLESKLLCASESLGVYEGGDLISASFLVGFGMTKASMARAMALQPEHMLVPHTGLIHHEACMTYLKKGEAWADCAKDLIVKACEDGYEDAKICRMLKETFYTGWNREKQPEAAFDLNAGYQVALIRKEFFGSGYEKDKKDFILDSGAPLSGAVLCLGLLSESGAADCRIYRGRSTLDFDRHRAFRKEKRKINNKRDLAKQGLFVYVVT